MGELPPLALATLEDVAEELLGFLTREEVRLVGRAFVGVAGGRQDAVDPLGHAVVEEPGDACGLGAI